MGHRDSSAGLSGHFEIWPARDRVDGAGACRDERWPSPAGLNPTSASTLGFSRSADKLPAMPARRCSSYSAAFLLGAIRVYQAALSPFLGSVCKFHPSCSNYAFEAIARWGARRGVLLALRRLLRCRPFSQGGWDPVPDTLEGLK